MSNPTDSEGAQEAFDAAALLERYRVEREKRLHSPGEQVYLAPSGKLARYLDDPYADDESTRAPVARTVQVALVGAGFGNLQAAVHLHNAGVHDFVLIDRAGDVGGVWYWNRYPGVACDIDSYAYLPLLEEMGYMPTQKYASAPEVFQYARSMATKFDLYSRALLRTEVSEIRWDDDADEWVISTEQGDVIRARFVNLATGPLQRLRLPNVPGVETFAGHSFHTARWDYAYTGGDAFGGLDKLSDEVVGIIGTGATAVQAIPHLGAAAKHLYVFQRTPAPVPPRNHKKTDPEWWASLQPGWQQARIENFNRAVLGEPIDEDLVADGWTELKRIGIAAVKGEDTEARRQMADFAYMQSLRDRVEAVVQDEATAEALKPWYNSDCKRPCFHDDYLQTFNRPNVTLVDTKGRGVERITPTGAVVDGHEYRLDCLIYATGFDFNARNMAKRNGFEIYGRDGRSLTAKWNDGGIATYQGYFSRDFPNLVMQSGAQGVMTANITHTLGEGARYLTHLVRYAQDRHVRTIEPTEESEQAWGDLVRSRNARGPTDAACTPGYYNNDGKPEEGTGISAFFPGNSQRFFARLHEFCRTGTLAGFDVAK
jgi:cyclohexanone monooxygenase